MKLDLRLKQWRNDEGVSAEDSDFRRPVADSGTGPLTHACTSAFTCLITSLFPAHRGARTCIANQVSHLNITEAQLLTALVKNFQAHEHGSWLKIDDACTRSRTRPSQQRSQYCIPKRGFTVVRFGSFHYHQACGVCLVMLRQA